MSDAFDSLLAEVDVLSLDIFDTTLGRLCAFPDDTFVLMEEALVTRYGDCLRGFARKRKECDAQVRRLAWEQRQAEEITLADIHSHLLASHPDWPATVEELASLELATEERLLYPLEGARRMIAEARKLGRKVIFISDMYLPRDFCEACLRKNGFSDYDALYLSSEIGVLKHSGKLFHHVLEDLQIPASRILHVGDNPHSDGKQASQAGMKTLIVAKAIEKINRFASNPLNDLGEAERRVGWDSLRLGLAAAGCQAEEGVADPFWYRLGYQVGGPLIFGYIQFILRQVEGRNIPRIYFLSRDGFILKQVYESLTEGRKDCPRAEYLYASRRSLNFASIVELDTKTENWLAEGTHLTAGDFLRRINLDPREHLQAIQDCSLSGPEHVISGGWEYDRLRQLYHRILPAIRKRAGRERDCYMGYLRDKGVFDSRPFVIVDVGWMTSIQHSFSKLCHTVDPDLPIEGFYLGTYPEAEDRAGPLSIHRHFLMEYGQPEETLKIIRHCVCLLEFFFAAPENTFLYMEGNSREGFRPVLADVHENMADLPALALIHQGVNDFCQFMRQAAGGGDFIISPGEIMPLLQRILANPTPEEAERLGEICYADGYGSYFHHSRMARPSGIRKLGLSKRRWKAEFKASHWPKGYYQRLSRLERLIFKLLHPSYRFDKPYG